MLSRREKDASPSIKFAWGCEYGWRNIDMKERHVKIPGGTWSKLFRLEKKWRQLVLDDVRKRESPHDPGIRKIKSMITKGVIASFFPSRWKRVRGSYVFVSFGGDSIVLKTKMHTNVPVICPNGKLRNIIQGDSLCELDAIYHLVHDVNIYPNLLRKFFLGILLRWVLRNAVVLRNQVFITNHDYYGKNSILVSLSQLIELNVLGVQHGLLRHAYVSSSVYPGYRNKIEAVYSESYRDVISSAKHPGASLPVLGAPFDVGNELTCQESAGSMVLYFVSSDDLRFDGKRAAIEEISRICRSLSVDFYVRPHPQELSRLDGYSFDFSFVGKDDVFRMDPYKTVFVGYYSTFLYEAALRGFRTIWITPPADQGGVDEFPEIRGVPNTFIQSGSMFGPEWLLSIFSEQPVVIPKDPLGPRMIRLLKNVFE